MSTPFILKAIVVPKEQVRDSDFNTEDFEFVVDVVTPRYTLKDLKLIKNYVFGFDGNKSLLIIDLWENPKVKIVRTEPNICLN